MALGQNRKYNSGRGIPVDRAPVANTGALLRPSAAVRGGGAVYGEENLPCMVETLPKTGTGLPTGDDAEQTVVDFGPSVWQCYVLANSGDAIAAGEHLQAVVISLGSTYNGNGEVGDWTNANAAIGSSTNIANVAAVDAGRTPVVFEVIDGTSIAAGSRGLCLVGIGF